MNRGLTKNNIINIHQDRFFVHFQLSDLLLYIIFIFYVHLALIIGKDIGGIYKHGQSELSTLSIKKPVFQNPASQKSSSIELTITCVSSIIDKEETDSVLCSQNTTQNDLNITNNDKIQSCETPRKNYSIPTTLTPKHHARYIGSMPVRSFN